ncbi:MAG: hypothetical protein ACOZBH_05435 [Patescibacteria group bacterium]
MSVSEREEYIGKLFYVIREKFNSRNLDGTFDISLFEGKYLPHYFSHPFAKPEPIFQCLSPTPGLAFSAACQYFARRGLIVFMDCSVLDVRSIRTSLWLKFLESILPPEMKDSLSRFVEFASQWGSDELGMNLRFKNSPVMFELICFYVMCPAKKRLFAWRRWQTTYYSWYPVDGSYFGLPKKKKRNFSKYSVAWGKFLQGFERKNYIAVIDTAVELSKLRKDYLQQFRSARDIMIMDPPSHIFEQAAMYLMNPICLRKKEFYSDLWEAKLFS